MIVETKKIDKLKRKITVDVRGDEFLKEKNELYGKYKKTLKVPGFRPGSAPMEVIERHHSKTLKEKLLDDLLPVFYRKALEENKILPASMPKVSDIELASESLKFSAEFEIRPEVEIKESSYKGIKVKEKKVKIEAVDIEKVITNIKDGIKKVYEKELDDNELAKWASYPDLDSFRKAIEAQLFVEKTRKRRQDIDSQIRTNLLKSVDLELPSSEIARHHQELVDRQMHNLQHRGLASEDIEKYKAEMEEKLKPVAANEVKLFYILEAVAKAQGLKIDNNLGEVALGYILNQAVYK